MIPSKNRGPTFGSPLSGILTSVMKKRFEFLTQIFLNLLAHSTWTEASGLNFPLGVWISDRYLSLFRNRPFLDVEKLAFLDSRPKAPKIEVAHFRAKASRPFSGHRQPIGRRVSPLLLDAARYYEASSTNSKPLFGGQRVIIKGRL